MSLVSIQISPNIHYPAGGNYSPPQYFAGYLWKDLPFGTGEIYALVRECLSSYYSGNGEIESESNLLGKWIQPGDRVVILPNMVMHRRPDESTGAFLSKCTHGSILRAVVDYAVLANRDAGRVTFGNAPIQACDYMRVAQETGSLAIRDFYAKLGYFNIGPHDFRSFSSKRTRFGALLEIKYGDPDQVINIDLGEDSLLEELFKGRHPHLRVGDYPAESTMSFHAPGKHIYAIDRRVLDADVIISVPKLKTHQKVGMTCALKGSVGAIARKECLAHHRRGSPELGGDEYPKYSFLRNIASGLADKTGSLDTTFKANMLRVLGKAYIELFRLGPKGIMGGAWHGNDTAWRMALDIVRLLRFGRVDGTLSDAPVRQHIGIVDGVIGGEGEGPLHPKPRHSAAILFSPDICSLDAACAFVMGYDPLKIPLVRNSFNITKYPITNDKLHDLSLLLNGIPLSSYDIVRKFGPMYITPKGWRGRVGADFNEGSHTAGAH